jgi:ABC-2 type transport system permease protein
VRSLVLIRHNFALLAREPGPVISRIAMPLVLITALRPIYVAALGTDGVAEATTGMLVLFSLLGLSIVGGGILTERAWHTLDRLRTTPARTGEILLGKAVPFGAVLVAQQAAILGYAQVVLGLSVRRWDLLLLAGLVWVATLLCAGAAVATMVRSQAELSAVTDIGGLVLTVLGGAMVPLALMPEWLRDVAPVSPGYWALTSLRAAVAGDLAATLRGTLVLLLVALVLATFATWRMSRGWSRSRLL